MPGPNYYIFNDLLEDSALGFQHSEIWKLPLTRASWISGARHPKAIATPIQVQLNPRFGTELLDSYHESIPVWSDRLIEVLRAAGVDNLDVYDAVIHDPRTGLTTSAFKAVNVLGSVDCADMEQSEYDPRAERGAREFIKLVIDPTKTMGLKMFRLHERPTLLLIHEDVKQGIEAARLKGIRADPVLQHVRN
ncbi:imm11 family protein [Myxococcus sp. CA040A]|uniref:imm11 family protein n=1 Tax=Myxococcus sp. CA040A TaxID=2741738 RepID=UPI00157B0283|nr:DUF1629 domain-containing protein [Myxococcus sp. CA040A]NTX02355.1 hypothetical protein [Myxococcus sp. CA040A]